MIVNVKMTTKNTAGATKDRSMSKFKLLNILMCCIFSSKMEMIWITIKCCNPYRLVQEIQ